MELLTEGYRVLTFDWRGWEPAENRQFAKTGTPEVLLLDTTAAVDYLRALPEVDGDRIAITGHSAGGTLAIQAGTVDPRINAVAAIGMEADVTPTAPRNLLWALGLYDEFRTPLRMLGYFHRSADTASGINVTVGSFAAGTARRLAVSPTADHFTEMGNRNLHREIVNWFNQANGRPVVDRMFGMQLRDLPIFIAWWAGLLLAVWVPLELLRASNSSKLTRVVPAAALAAVGGLTLSPMGDPVVRKSLIELVVIATLVVCFLRKRALKTITETHSSAVRGKQILRTAVLVWVSLLLTLVVNNAGSYALEPAFLLWMPVFAVQHLLDLAYTYTIIYPRALLFAPVAGSGVMPRLWVLVMLGAELASPGVILGTIARLFRRERRAPTPGKPRRSLAAVAVLVALLSALGVIIILRLQEGFLTADSAWAAGRFLLRFAVLPIVLFQGLRLLTVRRRTI